MAQNGLPGPGEPVMINANEFRSKFRSKLECYSKISLLLLTYF